jgi:DNA replication protein DnaC
MLPSNVKASLNEWMAPSFPTFVVLSGPEGAGKSFAAWAALREVGQAGTGFTCVSVAELLAAVGQGSLVDAERQLDELGAVPVLLLDDLGACGLAQSDKVWFGRLVERRWRDELKTIVVVVDPEEELAVSLGPHVTNRLFDPLATEHVAMSGKHRRTSPPEKPAVARAKGDATAA